MELTVTSSGRTELEVSRSVVAAILAEAAKAHPDECCGLLLGQATTVEYARASANVSPDPRTRFEIDPQALVDGERAARAGGPHVLGYYHSHPGGPNAPSATDRAQAAHDSRVWAIVGVDGIAFWRDDEHRFTRLSYTVVDR